MTQPASSLVIGTIAQVQTLERKLIDEWGFPALVLMERAALAVARFLDAHYPDAPVLVMAGTGNNGADGLAVARLLSDRSRTVRILTVGASLGELATRQMAWLSRRGVPAKGFSGAETFGTEWVLLDALFGIGLDRALKSDALLAIDWANRSQWRGVVALDVPSGLNADTGDGMGASVRATHTVTLGALKTGLFSDPALARIGTLWLADIGFPHNLLEGMHGRLNHPYPLPVPAPDAHKGTMGTVMIIAGSATMTGAAVLAARAAGRTGVGLVYLGVPASQRSAVAMAVPEAIVLPLPEVDGFIGPEATAVLKPQLARCKAVAIGPGMGQSPRVHALVDLLLGSYDGPVVLDADALPQGDAQLPARMGALVMTPHPGEMARMAGGKTEDVQKDRIGHALAMAKRHRAVIALKGARTVIARSDGTFALNATGNPMLATAGAGDVLTGLIAGLLARGMGAYEATATAVWMHGRAADVARESGMVSLLAGDIADRIPLLLNQAPPDLQASDEVRRIP